MLHDYGAQDSLISSSYSTLTIVAETFRQLLAPLLWCHVYVPVLPRRLLEHLQCPTPFMIGIHSSYAYKQDFPFAIDLTVIDLDTDSITLPPPRMAGDGEAGPSSRRISHFPRYILSSIRKPLFESLYPFAAAADRIVALPDDKQRDPFSVVAGLISTFLHGCEESTFLLHLGGGIVNVLDCDCMFRSQVAKLKLNSTATTLHAELLREFSRTQAFSSHVGMMINDSR